MTGGQLHWVVDGYTTTSHYPDSAAYDATAAVGRPRRPAGRGRACSTPRTRSRPCQRDLGRVTLYQSDPSDPSLRTWSKAFPG